MVTPAVAFNLAAGGRLVPVSAAAKVEGGLLGRAEGLAGAWTVAGRQVTAFLVEWGGALLQVHVALPTHSWRSGWSWAVRAACAG